MSHLTTVAPALTFFFFFLSAEHFRYTVVTQVQMDIATNLDKATVEVTRMGATGKRTRKTGKGCLRHLLMWSCHLFFFFFVLFCCFGS